MRLSLPHSPLDPIFNNRKRMGAIDVGNTPPGDPGVPPVACFTFSWGVGGVTLDAGCSTDSDGTIVGWAWDFGDGNTSTTGPTVTHAYATPGIYDVELIVTDNDGLDSTPFIDTVVFAYDQMALTFGPTRYVPGSSIGAGPLLDSYDDLILILGPDRYVPGDELNP